jgi:hypothetical protein
MTITRREMVLGVATLLAGLYGGLLYFLPGQLESWRLLQAEKAQAWDSIRRSKELVDKRKYWESEMQGLQALMPTFPADMRMDVHWMREMETKAAKNDLKIVRHEAGSEQQEGPIYELPLFCRRWEGSLDSLVHFLFDLQSEGAMLDIRYLYIKPKDKVIHDGRFDLYCAYRREEG